eukprot:TRINITY_DN7939_c0_g1_i1.p1 TRINITY_DN7939_c0_g1~~TRINITY_DN7939_c0_g1_i1.p1  ORF type:complete len:312 (+),score=75.52 TRINITY_DN7939_c0_g1_i1:3-938(+)
MRGLLVEIQTGNTMDATLESLSQKVMDQSLPMSKRMRALFSLRNVATPEAILSMKDGMRDDSALLAHEVAYCLGQIKDPFALPYLAEILKDESISTMVRHEAAESIGAIGVPESYDLLLPFANDPLPEVRDTVLVALELLDWKKENEENANANEGDSVHNSVDPAPPSKTSNTETLKAQLNDKTLSIFKRYKALFKLRNIGTDEAALIICETLLDKSNGSLFLHEIAYVLGQMENKVTAPTLIQVLKDESLHQMVRHEAAEALGAIADEESLPILEAYSTDPVPAVRDSCVVALDIYEHATNDEFQYADEE